MHSPAYNVFCYDNRYSINKSLPLDSHLKSIENAIKLWLDNPNREDLELNTELSIVKEAENNIFKMAPAAGGIVKVSGKLLVIKRKGLMDLPKGHLKKDEKAEIGAMREVEEETGLSGIEIVSKLPSTFHCYLLDNVWTFKETQWFEMKTTANPTFTPQEDEGITEVKLLESIDLDWFAKNTFRSLREILVPEMRRIITQ